MTKRKLILARRLVEAALESEKDVSRAELLKRRLYEIASRLDEMGGDES